MAASHTAVGDARRALASTASTPCYRGSLCCRVSAGLASILGQQRDRAARNRPGYFRLLLPQIRPTMQVARHLVQLLGPASPAGLTCTFSNGSTGARRGGSSHVETYRSLHISWAAACQRPSLSRPSAACSRISRAGCTQTGRPCRSRPPAHGSRIGWSRTTGHREASG